MSWQDESRNLAECVVSSAVRLLLRRTVAPVMDQQAHVAPRVRLCQPVDIDLQVNTLFAPGGEVITIAVSARAVGSLSDKACSSEQGSAPRTK